MLLSSTPTAALNTTGLLRIDQNSVRAKTVEAMRRHNPGIMIDVGFENPVPQHMGAEVGGPLANFALYNMPNGERFRALGLRHPNLKLVYGAWCLRLGHGDDLTEADNGYFGLLSSYSPDMSGGYTVAVYLRQPTRGVGQEVVSGNTGGPLIVSDPTGTAMSGIFLAYNAVGQMFLQFYHQGVLVWQREITPWTTVGLNFHFIATYNPDLGRIDLYINGVHRAFATGIATGWGPGPVAYFRSPANYYRFTGDFSKLAIVSEYAPVGGLLAYDAASWLSTFD